MDRRQSKTRRAVFQAFTALLERKSYGSITVQEIIDAANVGRSTFYAHFETKDDLLRALCREIFDHVFSHELMKEATHDFSGGDAGLSQRITHVLYHLRDSRGYLRGILSSESGELFMGYFKEYLALFFKSAAAGAAVDAPEDYVLNHVVCDFAETVRWWMCRPEYSPEDVSRFFLAAVPLPEAGNAPSCAKARDTV